MPNQALVLHKLSMIDRLTCQHCLNLSICFSAAPPVPAKKSPATLPRNFTLPKDPHGSLLRGRISTPTGSPHLGSLHPQLPPSCIIEELHRALATKHRQDRSVWGSLHMCGILSYDALLLSWKTVDCLLHRSWWKSADSFHHWLLSSCVSDLIVV